MYVELHAASAFSFLEAASQPEDLAQRAAELGYPAVALADRDGLYGSARFHQAMGKLGSGQRAIVGAELTIRLDGPELAAVAAGGSRRGRRSGEADAGAPRALTAAAGRAQRASRAGWREARRADPGAGAHAGGGIGADGIGADGRDPDASFDRAAWAEAGEDADDAAREAWEEARARQEAEEEAAEEAAEEADRTNGGAGRSGRDGGRARGRGRSDMPAYAADAADAAAQAGRLVRRSSRPVPRDQPFTWRLPVLVESQAGYRNLSRLITRMKLSAPKGEGALTLADLDGHTGGLVAFVGQSALAACRHTLAGPAGFGAPVAPSIAPVLFDRLAGLFGRDQLFVELQRHGLRDQERDNHVLRALASLQRLPLVATNGVRFAREEERPLCDVLTCIHHRTTLAAAGRRLARNAEAYLKSPAEMARLFSDLPEAVAATCTLADRLTFTLSDLGYRFPDFPVPPGETKNSYLRKMTEQGVLHRFGDAPEDLLARARAQIERELALITRLDLAGYFLIVWDIVGYCRQHDILVQGRGSAANSAVCYCLGITSIDPIRMELLFERFLTEQRGQIEMPDIDLDLPSGERREQVIQHVYQKYGPLGAGMTANVIAYRGKSAARDVGKALGLDPARVDRLAKVMHGFEWRDPNDSIVRNLRHIGLDPDDVTLARFARLWTQVQRLPRHLGQHSGGMVICHGRLDEIVPLEPASMPGRVVVQWDKDDCADLKIVKVDLLGLGMMAVLHETMTIVNTQQIAPEPPTLVGRPMPPRDEQGRDKPIVRSPAPLLHHPPLTLAAICRGDDPYVYEMLRRGDTVGVFQVESRAQMATLPRMRPEVFYDLVVEVAIVRPGPIVGQMMHPYLERRAGRQAHACFHPSLEPILRRTLGVPLFQEQLLRMAMTAAGFTGSQAEELRRALGFRRSEARMQAVEQNLRAGMAANGIDEPAAALIIQSISAFALYGFPESHAASFALLAYASAYLRAYYPAAFIAAMLNNQPMGFYHPATLIKDAQRHGVHFLPIDVQMSDWHSRVEPDGRTVRLGLQYVQGLRRDIGERIPLGRAAGPYGSIEQLIAATGLRREELATLAEIGALNAFGGDRRHALWQIERAVRPRGPLFERDTADETGLAAAPRLPTSPTLAPPAVPAPALASPTLASPTLASPALALPTLSSSQMTLSQMTLSESARPETAQPPQPLEQPRQSPLAAMTPLERVMADYEGTGFTIGPHPMAYRRAALEARGVRRASALAALPAGRRVRVAGAVITRQRPGTAKGFVFLTLEDETGIANIIVRPPLFDRYRLVVVEEPFLLVEGVLQQSDGVTAIRAEHLEGLGAAGPAAPSHDFH